MPCKGACGNCQRGAAGLSYRLAGQDESEVELGFLAGPETLLLLQGVFSQLFLAESARALAARFGGADIVYVALAAAFLAWLAAGCAAACLSNKLSGQAPGLWRCLALCCASPAAALLSCSLAIAAPPLLDAPCQELPSVAETLLLCLLSPLLFGLVNGALYGSLCGLLRKEEAGKGYASEALGWLLAGVLFSAVLASFEPPLSLLGIAGACLPVLGFIVCARRAASMAGKLGMGLLAAIAICAAGFLGGLDGLVSSIKWSRLMPGYACQGAAETSQGRVEFLKDPKGGASLLFRNGVLETSLPREREPDYPAALLAVAQADRGALSALLVCPAFSNFPSVLLSLPAVSKLTMVCPDSGLLELSRRSGILPEKPGVFRIEGDDPRRFVEGEGEAYDLMIVLGSASGTLAGNRLFTSEFFRAASKRLKPGGVLAAGMASAPGYSKESVLEFNGVLEATLKGVFPKALAAPGSPALFVAGGSELSLDYDVLDARLGRVMPGAKPFPDGLLGLVYSQREQLDEALRVKAAAVASSVNSDLSPSLSFLHLKRLPQAQAGDGAVLGLAQELLEWSLFLWKELLGAFLLAYAAARYFGSWKMSRKMAFVSFENGFYAAGLAVMLLFMLQGRCGSLYRDLAAATGLLCGGAALGAFLAASLPKARSAVKWLSPAIPAAAPLLAFASWDIAFYGVFAALLLGGCSAGAGYWEFNRRAESESSPGPLWSAEALGGAFGACVVSLFLIPAGGFAVCAVALALSRIPFAMSRGAS